MKRKVFRRMARGLTILALLLLATSPIILAQPEPPTPTPAVEYYAVETKVLDDGTSMDLVIINGPPTPPPGFEIERAAVPEHVAASATLPVPAYDWSYGCSATSAAMIAAYYDRTFYPNMYTGPTNGGVMPMDNSTWGHNTWPRCDGPGTIIVGECPLSATHNGIDGRSTRGHVDDYWIGYACPGPDPYEADPPEHTIGDCTGDYMETNKWYSAHGFNTDGGTIFVFNTSGAETYATSLEASGPPWSYDGGVGVKQFYESRGYVVTTAYNQYIKGQGSNPSLGFTYDQYKAEIDAGRPVMIHVEGHTMVGVGYDDSSSDLMYIHDTWDYSTYTMIWGSTYSGMQHEGVTIVQLQQPPDVSIEKRVVGPDPDPGDPITFTLAIANSGGVVAANTVVTDVVPSEVLTPTFASTLAITQTGVISYVWNVEPLGAGQSGVITIYGWISPSLESDFSFKNTASISDPEDNTPGNNTSSVTVGERKVYLPLVMRNYPYPCSDTQVIQNGGFESGNTIWVQQSGSYTIIGQQYPHSGSWNAWFGGYDNANDRLYQTVNIPAGISSARLTIYLYVYTTDSTSTAYDYFHVELQDSSGSTLQSFLGADNTMHGGGWYIGTMDWSDFSAHAGVTRRLFFQGTTDFSLYTNFFVDDVTLWAYCGSLPTKVGEAKGSSYWTWEKIDAPPGGLVPPGATGGKER